ncbi:MAG: UbiD family decarboxylase [Solirubrobacterales bacterium]
MNSAAQGARSLRTFLARLEATEGEGVAYVDRQVNPVHELAAVVKRMEGDDDRTVIFTDVAGHDIPVLMNLYGSKRRIAMALGLGPGVHPRAVMDHYLERLEHKVEPIEVDDGPVKEIVRSDGEVNLESLPIGIHAPEQGGLYINSGAMLVRDPATGAINAGIYRTMVQGPAQVTVSVDPFHDLGKVIDWGVKNQEPVPFAIVIGADPALFLASQAKLDMSHDVYGIVGSLTGEPVEVVRCTTNDLFVPAHAEIVIEGFIRPGETAAEGPYGEFSYYYGSDPDATLCQITAITHRSKPIFADILSTHREHRCLWLHPGREAGLLKRLEAVVPSVRSIHLPLDGAGMAALISIDKAHEGDPRRALLATLSADVFIKHAVIVDDEDIDIHDPARVGWALITRFQPDRDTIVVPSLRSYSEDPSRYPGNLTSKIGYDATKPLSGFPVPADLLSAEYADLDPSEYLRNPNGS